MDQKELTERITKHLYDYLNISPSGQIRQSILGVVPVVRSLIHKIKDEIEKEYEEKYEDKSEAIAVWWKIEDVLQVAYEEDVELSNGEAYLILEQLKKKHDCNYGITWDTIRLYVNDSTLWS